MTLLAVAVAGRGLVDPAEPVFRADDEAVLRGAAAFETVRTYGGRPFLLDRHLVRLRFSITALALPPATGIEELVELVLGAAPADHALRLYRSSRELVVTAATLPDGQEELRRRGISVQSVTGAPSSLLAGAKTTSYAQAFAALRAAGRDGFDDVLFVAGNVVLETATANIWWRHGERISTPVLRPGVLPGVTRELMLELTDAEEGEFALAELTGADEAFTTSSVREVMPVVSLDGRAIGTGAPGPLAARLQGVLRLRSQG